MKIKLGWLIGGVFFFLDLVIALLYTMDFSSVPHIEGIFWLFFVIGLIAIAAETYKEVS